MPDIGFVNGRFMPLAEAVVSVEERGFQFGDGVYEVIRTYSGKPFHMDAHLRRLERSAKALQIASPFPTAEWTHVVHEGVRKAGFRESKVYIQITRGVAPRDHVFPVDAQPSAIMTIRELQPLSERLQISGVSVILLDDFRWGRCDIKSINLLPNVMARQQAYAAGTFEAVFVKDGMVTEGAVSNVMIMKDGTLFTAPEGPRILAGVTRALVLELARKEGISVNEQAVRSESLVSAEEVFLTGTTVEVLSVIRVDGNTVGSGQPGSITKRLLQRFRSLTT
ncbi:MAG: D-amino-acid transaminase [Nitrospiraceae bacterium]